MAAPHSKNPSAMSIEPSHAGEAASAIDCAGAALTTLGNGLTADADSGSEAALQRAAPSSGEAATKSRATGALDEIAKTLEEQQNAPVTFGAFSALPRTDVSPMGLWGVCNAEARRMPATDQSPSDVCSTSLNIAQQPCCDWRTAHGKIYQQKSQFSTGFVPSGVFTSFYTDFSRGNPD